MTTKSLVLHDLGATDPQAAAGGALRAEPALPRAGETEVSSGKFRVRQQANRLFSSLFRRSRWRSFWAEVARREPKRRTLEKSGPRQAPQNQRAAMTDKSPRQTMTKKSGKSLKEKRATKRSKAAEVSQTEALLHTKKR
jgi:hypothetical protein